MKRSRTLNIVLVLILCNFIYSYLIKKDIKAYKPTQGNTITYILIDGLSSEIFYKELDKGNLPNIQKIVKKSLLVKNGISSCPTMTGNAFYAFLTDKYVVESGVNGFVWFDKKEKGHLN